MLYISSVLTALMEQKISFLIFAYLKPDIYRILYHTLNGIWQSELSSRGCDCQRRSAQQRRYFISVKPVKFHFSTDEIVAFNVALLSL